MRENSVETRALRMQRFEVEDKEDWHCWCQRIPSIPMRDDWKIKVIPPNMGAMARFVITRREASVSVYLDVFDRLGSFGYGTEPVPHSEIYPDASGDNWRCPMEDVDELVTAIEASLDRQDWKKTPRGPVMQMKPAKASIALSGTMLYCPKGSNEWIKCDGAESFVITTAVNDEPLIVGSPEYVASAIDDFVANLRAKAGKEEGRVTT